MIKASNISIAMVTGEEIGKCHKVFEGSTPAWMVESESDPTTEYKVKHSKATGFTCTCKAGQTGFSNCKAGYCKHVAWAFAAEQELREAMKELEAAIVTDAQVQAAMSDPATVEAALIAREAPAKVARKRTATPYQPKAFSILKV